MDGIAPVLPYGRAMPKRISTSTPKGLPTRKQILDFIATSDVPAGKREIARRLKPGLRRFLQAAPQ